MLASILMRSDNLADRRRAERLLRQSPHDPVAQDLLRTLLFDAGASAGEPPNESGGGGSGYSEGGNAGEPAAQEAKAEKTLDIKADHAAHDVETVLDRLMDQIIADASSPDAAGQARPVPHPDDEAAPDAAGAAAVAYKEQRPEVDVPKGAQPRPERTAVPQTDLARNLEAIESSAKITRYGFIIEHGEGAEKRQAEAALAKLADSDDLPLARFMLLGVQPGLSPSERDLAANSFALALMAAVKTDRVEQIAKLKVRRPNEALACAFAEAQVTGDYSSFSALLRAHKDEAASLGAASRALYQLGKNKAFKLEASNDNQTKFIAALASSFEMPLAL
jgi:hypothetical protein